MVKFIVSVFIATLVICGIVWGQQPSTPTPQAPNNAPPIVQPGSERYMPADQNQAQTIPTTYKVQIAQFNTKEYPTVGMYVSVLDYNGNPVRGLNIGDFSITEEGSAIDNTSIKLGLDATSRLPFAVCFAIDLSISMQMDLNSEKQAVRMFINGLSDKDQISIIGFSDSAQLYQDWTTDKNKALTTIDTLSVINNTALWDAARMGIMQFGKPEAANKRRILIILSDGKNNVNNDLANSRSVQDFLHSYRAEGKEVSIFSIGLGNRDDIEEENLKELAFTSGGYYQYAAHAGELTNYYSQLSDYLRNEYLLIYPSYKRNREGTLVNASVQVRGSQADSIYRAPGLARRIGRTVIPGLILCVLFTIALVYLTFQKVGRTTWLTVMLSPLEGKDYNMSEGTTIIGKSELAHIMIHRDKSILPQHCTIRNVQGGYLLEATDPDHPFICDGRALASKMLVDRDKFIIGHTQLVFHDKLLKRGEVELFLETAEEAKERVQLAEEAHNAEKVSAEAKIAQGKDRNYVPVKLRVVTGRYRGQTFNLPSEGNLKVGRKSGEIVLPEDQRCSREHCEFHRDITGLTVVDIGSTNGTYINGKRINTSVTLHCGDQVLVGTTTFICE